LAPQGGRASPSTQASASGGRQSPSTPQPSTPKSSAATPALLASPGAEDREQREAERGTERERLEEELSMAKALLMLNNVQLNMDLNEERSASAPEVVSLKGNRRLIQMLITLKQKVSLLNQQYLLLRGDMLYMSHEMNVCRQWVLQSFCMAMQRQCQENSTLQSRFERLSKVLN